MDRTQNMTLWAVYAGSLALAFFIGYSLAVAQGVQSAVVVGGVIALLVAPLLLRAHQPLLTFCWYATINLTFLPGSLPSWLVVSVVVLAILLMQRGLKRCGEFNMVRVLTWPIAVFSAVVIATMMARGGVAIQWLGSGELAGGRKYLYILGAVAGYFALSLQRIPRDKAAFYSTLFYIGGLTGFIGPLATYLGGPFSYLMLLFNPVEGVATFQDTFRVKGMSFVGNAIFGAMLARYGFGGVFHTTHVWRPVLLLTGVLLGLVSGYRTLLVLYGGTLALMFILEGWHKTRWLLVWVCVLGIGTGVLYKLTPMLPTPVQRALAVLPLPVSAAVRMDASGTIEWRQGLWEALLADVPQYLWLGKGMAISSREMDWAETLSRFGGKQWDYSYITGEHHNGFLSVIIAFGVWGLAAFIWMLAAGWWVLWHNWKNGRPDLANMNALLLSSYLCWIVLFFTYWGTLYWSLRDFTGILGMSVALNHGVALVRERAQPAGD
jgi:hypothetical protein